MKYCTKCGEILNDTAEYCSRCGERVGESTVRNEQQPKKRKDGVFIFSCILLVIICVIMGAQYINGDKSIFSGITQEDPHVTFVKNGSPESYPNITYDEAFSNFFANRSWKYFKSDKGLDVVEFTGDCLYHDVQVTATIQFVLDMDNGTFEMEYLAFNDVPQNLLYEYALITKAFESVN